MGDSGRSVFGRNLRAFRESRGLTQPQVAEALGVSVPTENKWENKGVQPRRKVIDDLMGLYLLSEDDLLSETGGFYAKLHGLVDAPSGATAVKASPARLVPVRVLGAAHAGDPDEPWEFDGEAMLYEDLAAKHPNCYALQVNGTCMNRNFTDRDVIFVDPDIVPGDGNIGVVDVNGETVVRRIRKGNSSLMLVAETTEADEWDDIIVQGEYSDYRPLGTVFWWQSDGRSE